LTKTRDIQFYGYVHPALAILLHSADLLNLIHIINGGIDEKTNTYTQRR
jgi:hypothetical protein